jgi:hypothetical protein
MCNITCIHMEFPTDTNLKKVAANLKKGHLDNSKLALCAF